MHVLEIKKLKSFRVSHCFVRYRRTYVINKEIMQSSNKLCKTKINRETQSYQKYALQNKAGLITRITFVQRSIFS